MFAYIRIGRKFIPPHQPRPLCVCAFMWLDDSMSDELEANEQCLWHSARICARLLGNIWRACRYVSLVEPLSFETVVSSMCETGVRTAKEKETVAVILVAFG